MKLETVQAWPTCRGGRRIHDLLCDVVSGVFAAFCRHGLMLAALNMVTGEKWAYPVLLLYIMMLDGATPAVVW